MYICRHCGLEYKTDEAVMCPRCQAPKGKGTNFCPFCGEQVTPEQKICVNCGVEMATYGVGGVKSKIAAGLLGIFLGAYGVHNFYLGYYKRAVVQLVLTLLGYGLYIGSVVSFALSAGYMADMELMGSVLGMLGSLVLLAGVGIWAFVESILIFCGKINKDGKGRLLK
ncbi:MAG: NINE protein [Lachnospiraceae bacterium]|nr:NINE protein [Lachnospiraceae bacterium]